MTIPRLTFYCELDSGELTALFDSQNLITNLNSLGASISMGIIDMTPERAEVVRKLNHSDTPVIAWLLLPKEQGYWFNIDNFQLAVEQYDKFISWTEEYSLEWSAVGLDIEPDIREIALIVENKLAILPRLFSRLYNRKRLKDAEKGYQELVEHIRSHGYFTESYQMPIIEDERKVGSTIVRRLSGLVDVQVDREVLMLYTSILRPYGVGLLGSYASEAQAIAIGVTGGGVDIDIGAGLPLTWDEFSRDLRLAWYSCDDIYIFSLEGCIEQGFLTKLLAFQWDQPILLPVSVISRVDRWRSLFRSGLWLSAYGWVVLVAVAGVAIFIKMIKRWINRKRV